MSASRRSLTTKPGLNVFARMLCRAFSTASARVSALSPPLLAA
jgi:hypothetical protein